MDSRIPAKGMMLHRGKTAPNSWGLSAAKMGLGRLKRRIATRKNKKTGEAENLFSSICSAPWWYFLSRRRYISVKFHCQGDRFLIPK